MSVVTGDLGKASVSVNGEHDSSLAYEKLCIVSANGISYISRKAVPISVPISNDEYWQPMTDDATAAAAAAAAANDARNAVSYIADIFSEDNSYSIGNYVIHNGILYRFTSAHSAGVWDNTEVTAVSAAGELENKQAKLTFDDTPTASSTNPVTSGGVKAAIDEHNQFYASSALGNNNAGFHASLYRGKNLGSGSSALTELYTNLANSFDDQFVGDYITLNGHTYLLAHPNYWYNFGDTACATHHWLVIPAASDLVSGKMNSTNITTGAYIGSDFYTGANGNTAKASIEAIIKADFGANHILTHREHLQNAVTNGYESGGTWYDSQIDLMTERMVYGCDIFHNQMAGTNIPNWYSIDYGQLALFRYRRDTICTRGAWWLRDVVSSAVFASVDGDGVALNPGASNSLGIRPAFGIIA